MSSKFNDLQYPNNLGPTIWLTGLPGSGKTTLGLSILKEFRQTGIKSELLDGDELRKTISSELGFTKEHRFLHLKRVTFLCELLNKHEIVTIVALISPYRESRHFARNRLPNFIEVWVNCPINICIERDPKGLYKRASRGKMNSLTGIQDPYEEPLHSEVTVNTNTQSIEDSTRIIVDYFKSRYIRQ